MIEYKRFIVYYIGDVVLYNTHNKLVVPNAQNTEISDLARDTLWVCWWTDPLSQEARGAYRRAGTPGLHNKIPAYKIFARGWVAQEPFFS